MEKQSVDVIATFDAADGRVVVKEVTQYRQYERDDVIEFMAENGKRYIAYVGDIMLMSRMKLSALSI